MFTDSILWRMAVIQVWQLTAIIVVLGGPATLLAKRRPHLAYVLWLVVLVKAITPPIWSSNLGVFSHTFWFSSSSSSVPTSTEIRQPALAVNSNSSRSITQDRAVQPDVNNAFSAHPTESPAAPTNWFAAIWLAGSFLMLTLSLMIVVLRHRSLRQHSSPDPTIIQGISYLTKEMGVAGRVHLAINEKNLGPALCGLWRPTILLPRCLADENSFEELRPILVHELIHLRRGDHLVAVLQCLVHIMWWFHPLVWFMNRAITRTRERCCDLESVDALKCEPSQYARCLLNVLSAKANLRPMYGLPGVRPVEITRQRVKEIIAMNGQVLVRRSGWQLVIMLISAVIVLPGASLVRDTEVVAEEPATTSTAKPAIDRSRLLLKYGDGKEDGKKSIGGSGEMILFETPGETGRVRAVRVHGARYGYPQPPKEDIEITLLTEDMTDVLHTELVPYSLFKRVKENRWTHLPFRDPVEVPKKFWVVLNFNAEQTKGVYVSYDTSTKGAYSRVGLSEEDAKETDFGGDWMVQVLLAE